jgi:hypothetical protein
MKGYLYDNDGYFYGDVDLQASPLEPGVYFDQPSCTRTAPPETKENEIAFWSNGQWQKKPNYSGLVFYSKTDKSEKRFEKGEALDTKYTDKKPLENEQFQKFENNSWVIDTVAKANMEKQKLINQALGLLASSDWTQTLDNLNLRGQTWVDAWATYRAELRKVVNETSSIIPTLPNV